MPMRPVTPFITIPIVREPAGASRSDWKAFAISGDDSAPQAERQAPRQALARAPASRAAASSITDSRLQNANRTSERPTSGWS